MAINLIQQVYFVDYEIGRNDDDHTKLSSSTKSTTQNTSSEVHRSDLETVAKTTTTNAFASEASSETATTPSSSSPSLNFANLISSAIRAATSMVTETFSPSSSSSISSNNNFNLNSINPINNFSVNADSNNNNTIISVNSVINGNISSELSLYGSLHHNATRIAVAAAGAAFSGASAGSGTSVVGIGVGGINAATSTFDSNGNYDVPEIPNYIRYTSMVFCIVIMCLGVIGNIMVSFYFFTQ